MFKKFLEILIGRGQTGTFTFGLFEWPLKTFLLKVFQQWLGEHFEGLTKGCKPV